MDKRILLLRNLILANLTSLPNIEEISIKLNISTSRLRQITKESTGMSFGEYVRHQRLERARELLETTFLRAQEVSVAVGIGDQSYFNRIFKEKYGLSPKKYHAEHCRMYKSDGDSGSAKL